MLSNLEGRQNAKKKIKKKKKSYVFGLREVKDKELGESKNILYD